MQHPHLGKVKELAGTSAGVQDPDEVEFGDDGQYSASVEDSVIPQGFYAIARGQLGAAVYYGWSSGHGALPSMDVPALSPLWAGPVAVALRVHDFSVAPSRATYLLHPAATTFPIFRVWPDRWCGTYNRHGWLPITSRDQAAAGRKEA